MSDKGDYYEDDFLEEPMPESLPVIKVKEKKTGKYWYFIAIRECVLCGNIEEDRYRRYTPRPENPEDRHEYSQFACGEHFC